MKKILAISGSIRKGSYNEQLAQLVVKRLIEKGADAEYIDLGNYPMPIFDEDLESQHHPKCALELAKRFAQADAIFIATPEYNGSLSPLLKNTIDWLTRQKQGAFSKATFGLGAASTGSLAGIMVLSHLRDILSKVGALMAPTALGVGMAATAFDENGELTVPPVAARADALVNELLTIRR
ncbi:NADPH-dependent FMN reductase [Maritalea sp.]|uniref:NADPH-dependent FMN reductase n=1 Tax=Maritalea sp. TaxID=2003361 RepID=UPI003EF2C0E1